jgi:hypothetical protein
VVEKSWHQGADVYQEGGTDPDDEGELCVLPYLFVSSLIFVCNFSDVSTQNMVSDVFSNSKQLVFDYLNLGKDKIQEFYDLARSRVGFGVGYNEEVRSQPFHNRQTGFS